ncbi:hypothetical protein [Pseudodesulfovibrio piezophilus]|uniref:Uncharacterized protein n=1 Tax=Pseudodesulfovibrio piezophilus (strain DSM 21447 / JCM 15486 / C1TLV30) TaxID=1322246 RepID=M1WKT4_PSEP2|nr:hypothetical protein [Pseudodesulfovibrio piezophilus]CCH50156.1 protein of unknown function [Pseudodesulfovibrio piezophilus C1TLV30]
MVWYDRESESEQNVATLLERIEQRVKREVWWMSGVASCLVSVMVVIHVALIHYSVP